jgi:hypothetical protein
MKNVLERFEKLAAAHSLNADCAAAMRGLLQDAHTAGYGAHMTVAAAADANEDEQDSLPVGRDDEEPEDDEKEEAKLRTLAKVIKKEVRKSVKKELRKHLQRSEGAAS